MKVIEVTYNWPAEVFIQRHLQTLQASCGMKVRLVARQRLDGKELAASIASRRGDIPALVMPNFDHLSRLGQLLSLRHLVAAGRRPRVGQQQLRHEVLLAFFERLQPDLIHFHASSLAALMRWIPNELGVPYTVSVRGSDVQVHPLRSQEEASRIAEALVDASGVHVVCKHLGDLSSDLVGHPLEYTRIYTTVPIPDSLMPYAPESESSDAVNLLAVGRLHWRKNFRALLIAVKTLLDRGLKTRVTLVGSGEQEDAIRYWTAQLGIESAVTLTGKVDYDEICILLRRCHAFVQSSIVEGFSNATGEAMALGCPVFATDVGGTAEIIENGRNGFLLPPLEPRDWADILALARRQSLMEQVRAVAYETACRHFSAKRHAQAFASFYTQAISCGTSTSYGVKR